MKLKDLIEHSATEQNQMEKLIVAQMLTIAALVRKYGSVELTDEDLAQTDPVKVQIERAEGLAKLSYPDLQVIPQGDTPG